ncbi:Aldo/keto reductase [Fomitiporia mediterranea MF3/22]|uniref:Aldo/keto reductase n=1 Tax=Fomitiporia mediterranea (strain MF3/22) TaxID=694068 RepID=UPI0004408BAC|nr:Aldo/keto reductase [Fomitiporia mediterranea MF3/22]EJD00148.1 Aldo/keto reductase [Fomitiporia mediterranea MF3/22]
MISSRRFVLNDGLSIPAVGVGCWMGAVGEGEHVTEMVKNALLIGYRHIDTHSAVGNEVSVGKALKRTNVPRADVFITTKLDSKDHGRVQEALDTSLQKLGLDYVNLYLMHWPLAVTETGKCTGFSEHSQVLQPGESPTFVETWKQMEQLVATGKARSIGVSNFSIKTLTTLLEHASIVPAVNQVELHPCLPQHDLFEFCNSHKIHLTAYSPLGKHKFASDPSIVEIGHAHGVTGAQVLLSWAVQRGTSIVPKTLNEERLKENVSLINLGPEEMATLDLFHKKPGMHHSVCGFHSAELGGSCFGWTYEQLGWHMTLGGIVPS